MVSSTYVDYGKTFMIHQWGNIWNLTSSGYSINGGLLLSLAGAGSAIIFSIIGAYDNGAKLIKYVEAGMNDWLKYYGKGKYEEILDMEDEADRMEQFLSEYTWDMMLYSMVSMWHSMFLIATGLFGAIWLILQITLKQSSGTGSLQVGWKYFLFGVMLGSVNYFAGNVSENLIDEVMNSIGFYDHTVSSDDKNLVTSKTISGPEGVSTMTITETYPSSKVSFDYLKLIKMQDNWEYFFWLQRFIQMMGPYMLFGALEFGVASVLVLFFVFTY